MNRTLDATFLNTVANDPSVRPLLGATGLIDLSADVANTNNVVLVWTEGGFFAQKFEVGLYECHTLFLPGGRGEKALAYAVEALRYMFTRTDCLEIVTRVPSKNKAADLFARSMGFVRKFVRKAAWPTDDGFDDVTYYGLTLDVWAMRDDDTRADGEWFHRRLESAKLSSGSALEVHPDDEAHDRAAGAAVQMIKTGNPQKAVWFYNRWARLAGYQMVTLVSMSPTIIDIGDAVIEAKGTEMEILLCR